MRGEDPDNRHLNQFFHCEAEIAGTLEDLYPVVEGFIKVLSEMMLALKPLVSKMSIDWEATKSALDKTVESREFRKKSLDDACDFIEEVGLYDEFVKTTTFGREINCNGEIFIVSSTKENTPMWLHSFDRDTVAFY